MSTFSIRDANPVVFPVILADPIDCDLNELISVAKEYPQKTLSERLGYLSRETHQNDLMEMRAFIKRNNGLFLLDCVLRQTFLKMIHEEGSTQKAFERLSKVFAPKPPPNHGEIQLPCDTSEGAELVHEEETYVTDFSHVSNSVCLADFMSDYGPENPERIFKLVLPNPNTKEQYDKECKNQHLFNLQFVKNQLTRFGTFVTALNEKRLSLADFWKSFTLRVLFTGNKTLWCPEGFLVRSVFLRAYSHDTDSDSIEKINRVYQSLQDAIAADLPNANLNHFLRSRKFEPITIEKNTQSKKTSSTVSSGFLIAIALLVILAVSIFFL